MNRFKINVALLIVIILMVTNAKVTLMAEPVEPIPDHILASPKPGWNELPQPSQQSLGYKLLMWVPNRFLDLWDVFKIDLGAGPSLGATVRLTRYVQVTSRKFAPASLRLGLMGRRFPIMLESSDEQGVAPFIYQTSRQRDICSYEVGAGLELVLIGGYVGFCPEEIFDFLGGIFLIDLEQDDY
jgi:hypothetical protein